MVPTTVTQRTILVVEDELPLVELIVAKLERFGWRPISARTVDEAWSFLDQLQSVDLVWLDHFMPDKVGLELLKQIRKSPKWTNLPVVVVTNAMEPEIMNGYIKLGVKKYYPKMLSPLDRIITELDLLLQTGS